MRALFIGDYIDISLEQYLLNNKEKLLSGYLSCKYIVEGMDMHGIDMDTINSYIVNNVSIKEVPSSEWSRNGVSKDYNVGYKNRRYLRNIFRTHDLIKTANKWIKEKQPDNDLIIFVYSMHAPFIRTAVEVKKKIKKSKIVLIVPDLPAYMDLSASMLKRILKKLDWVYINCLLNKVDKYVLYTEPMASYLNLKQEKWILMEGLIDTEQYKANNCLKMNEKTSIMYSGALSVAYGIPELLQAMDILGDEYELWLTGDGDATDEIRNAAKKNPNIKMLGYFNSRSELLKTQAKATMLISTRKNNEVASNYCFPSKLFEYMASGRPVLSCFIGGIPNEYHKYLIEVKNITGHDIAEAIINVKKMGSKEQEEFGYRAKMFVLNNKSIYEQTRRIIDFASSNLVNM